MSDKKIELDTLDNIENLSMSDAFVCDFETGECGPVDMSNIEKENKEKERQDEDNSMV